jgi:hypothetical protein
MSTEPESPPSAAGAFTMRGPGAPPDRPLARAALAALLLFSLSRYLGLPASPDDRQHTAINVRAFAEAGGFRVPPAPQFLPAPALAAAGLPPYEVEFLTESLWRLGTLLLLLYWPFAALGARGRRVLVFAWLFSICVVRPPWLPLLGKIEDVALSFFVLAGWCLLAREKRGRATWLGVGVLAGMATAAKGTGIPWAVAVAVAAATAGPKEGEVMDRVGPLLGGLAIGRYDLILPLLGAAEPDYATEMPLSGFLTLFGYRAGEAGEIESHRRALWSTLPDRHLTPSMLLHRVEPRLLLDVVVNAFSLLVRQGAQVALLGFGLLPGLAFLGAGLRDLRREADAALRRSVLLTVGLYVAVFSLSNVRTGESRLFFFTVLPAVMVYASAALERFVEAAERGGSARRRRLVRWGAALRWLAVPVLASAVAVIALTWRVTWAPGRGFRRELRATERAAAEGARRALGESTLVVIGSKSLREQLDGLRTDMVYAHADPGRQDEAFLELGSLASARRVALIVEDSDLVEPPLYAGWFPRDRWMRLAGARPDARLRPVGRYAVGRVHLLVYEHVWLARDALAQIGPARFPGEPGAAFVQANALFEGGRGAEALALLAPALGRHPGDPFLRLWRRRLERGSLAEPKAWYL